MKTILMACLIAVSFSSCSKCFDCNLGSLNTTICKDNPQYSKVKQFGTYMDDNGQEYVCIPK